MKHQRTKRWVLKQTDRAGTDTTSLVPNQSPNQFNGRFDSACYLLDQFVGFISTRTSSKIYGCHTTSSIKHLRFDGPHIFSNSLLHSTNLKARSTSSTAFLMSSILLFAFVRSSCSIASVLTSKDLLMGFSTTLLVSSI